MDTAWQPKTCLYCTFQLLTQWYTDLSLVFFQVRPISVTDVLQLLTITFTHWKIRQTYYRKITNLMHSCVYCITHISFVSLFFFLEKCQNKACCSFSSVKICCFSLLYIFINWIILSSRLLVRQNKTFNNVTLHLENCDGHSKCTLLTELK